MSCVWLKQSLASPYNLAASIRLDAAIGGYILVKVKHSSQVQELTTTYPPASSIPIEGAPPKESFNSASINNNSPCVLVVNSITICPRQAPKVVSPSTLL